MPTKSSTTTRWKSPSEKSVYRGQHRWDACGCSKYTIIFRIRSNSIILFTILFTIVLSHASMHPCINASMWFVFCLLAVGKSTFARLLQSASSDWEVVHEQVSKWQCIESGDSKVYMPNHVRLIPTDVNKTRQVNRLSFPLQASAAPQTVSNLLQMMYQDPQRWSYTFQTYSCMGRMKTQLQPPPAHLLNSNGTPVQVFERSVYSDRYEYWNSAGSCGCWPQ